MQDTAVNPQLSYDNAYSYPAPGSPHPHGPTAIGGFTITNDADGNQVNTLGTGTSAQSNYLYDEENRLSCANMGPQMPSPSCSSQGATQFIYDHAGVRKVKSASSPTIHPNQYYSDFGGGSGNQFKHIFIGSERILTKKARVAPDRQHWYYHPDHLGSTAMVTNENSQLVDAVHYFPFGEVWLEERPSSLPEEFFFTAKEFDPETGFYDFGARYLDPRFAKWMSADPALGKHLPGAGQTVAYQSPTLGNNWRTDLDLPGLGGAFQPMNLALYGYGHHNPATLLDPNGLDPDSPGFFRSTSPTMRSATSPSCRTMRSSLAASPAATSATPSAARGPRPITYDDLYGLISSTGIRNHCTMPCRLCRHFRLWPNSAVAAAARHGSYRGISRHQWRWSTTVEDDPKKKSSPSVWNAAPAY